MNEIYNDADAEPFHAIERWRLKSNNLLHREDGPAVIWSDGECMWCLNGVRVGSNKQFQHIAGISDEDMTIMVLKYGNVT